MKTTTKIATAALGLAAAQALAQPTDVPVPKHSCEPRPAYPGLQAMKSEVEVKQFEKQMKDYKDCIVGYISQRKAARTANETAENAAAKEYNETMAKIRSDQESAMKEQEAAKASAQKNEPASPRAPGKY
jgi:hypothetical protein